jgi:hypothetical protein
MVASVEQINEWQERVARWQASGLSQRAFAIENGVSQRQISYWARRLGQAQLSPAFVPVRVTPTGASSGIVLHSERGWTVTVPLDVPARWLAELMRAL